MMRLINADKLKDTECKLCRFCLEDSNGNKDIDGCREMGCGVMDMIDSQPTIKAIQVEEHENKVRDLEQTIEWLMDDIVMLQEEVLE